MEREMKTYAPEGCEIKSVKIVDGVAVMKYGEIESKLPKSWEKFCEMNPVQFGECYINDISDIRHCGSGCKRRPIRDKNIIPDRANAEAVLALCQLIQLRNAYNGEWVPDWTKNETKWMILVSKNTIETTTCTYVTASELYFKSEELRDEFLRNFRPVIEKLKPLYGIKTGGE